MTPEEILLLGKLSGQVEAVLTGQEDQKKNIGKLFDGMEKLNATVSKLPCADEGRRLEQAEKDIQDLQGCISTEDSTARTEKLKGNISLRNLVVAIICTAAFTTGLNIGLNLIFTGKP
ncbi:hypothetical protein M0R72_12980 [Candidatus Pacearchaeota archaeon]|jgi:hypothetical protein|nr:hypothetical protein [Candidatus Pacearchaeota archaeon]